MKTGWRRMSDEPIKDLELVIKEDIERYKKNFEIKFYVGCDSQVHGDVVNYTKAIALRKMGCGVLAYYKVDKEKYNKNFRERLWNETYKAVETAQWVDGILMPLNYMIEEVHADLNPSPEFKSHCVMHSCLGYIKSMGFVGKVKPEAWVASGVADNKNK
jgi:predicted RNase H-related nuclease YkuK (DUF458 family)